MLYMPVSGSMCSDLKACDPAGVNNFSYFRSSKYSDLVIHCEDQKFKVHKVIVCGQSSFFSKACDGEWKVWLHANCL
jgi:hypothetical protein